MAKNLSSKLDFSALQQQLVAQCRDLDPKDPSLWPAIPRYSLFVATSIAIVIALWFVWLSSSEEILQQEQQKELTLREDYKKKLSKAVNLDVLKKQREQVLFFNAVVLIAHVVMESCDDRKQTLADVD